MLKETGVLISVKELPEGSYEVFLMKNGKVLGDLCHNLLIRNHLEGKNP
ncbi:hypothetical protein IPG41_03495 [Candidatus Peregrinibacteria bacterium]|nr:MAG: hypothetical protein IPG41_03495 [Candidatus Peregrinibacteria bacterium]